MKWNSGWNTKFSVQTCNSEEMFLNRQQDRIEPRALLRLFSAPCIHRLKNNKNKSHRQYVTSLVMNFILQRNYWLSVLPVGLHHFFQTIDTHCVVPTQLPKHVIKIFFSVLALISLTHYMCRQMYNDQWGMLELLESFYQITKLNNWSSISFRFQNRVNRTSQEGPSEGEHQLKGTLNANG